MIFTGIAEREQYDRESLRSDHSGPATDLYRHFFESPSDKKSPSNPVAFGYFKPRSRAHHILAWAWLMWQVDPRPGPVERGLALVPRRGLELHQHPQVTCDREQFDLLALCCAVLSGDRKLMRDFAASAWHHGHPDLPADTYPLYPAWCGLLKFEVLGDAAARDAQAEVALATGRLPWVPLPGKALTRRFLHGDPKAFGKQLRSDVRKFEASVKPNAKVDGEPVFDVRKPSGHKPWPYMQAVLAKLVALRGHGVECESVWMPGCFLRA